MKPSDETLVTRFIDGELDGGELAAFEARIADEPELRDAVEAASSLGESLREVFAGGDVIGHDMLMASTSLTDSDVPNAESFNADVLARIKNETGGGDISHA